MSLGWWCIKKPGTHILKILFLIKIYPKECTWRLLVSTKSQIYEDFKLLTYTDTCVFVVLFKPGTPEDNELHQLANDVSPTWKKLGRELKIKDLKLSQLDEAHQQDAYEKAYQMLLHWRQTRVDQATYQMLYYALTSDVVGRNDLGKKYCCVSWFK